MFNKNLFDKELKQLQMDMLKMASLVEESIDNTVIALKKQDTALALKIFKDDDIIDDLEVCIENKCFNLIESQQPVSKDLRAISSALKIITDMERIADHSSDIAEITMRMSHEKYIKPLIDIPKMADLAKDMVKKAIDSYLRNDEKLAREVCSSDDAVDELFYKVMLELTCIMKNDASTVEQGINFLMIAKYLERMADHATNIGEWVVYNVTGVHAHLARVNGKKEITNPFANFKSKYKEVN